MRTSKIKMIGGGAAAAVLATALTLSGASSASAQGLNGVTNCAAPGGKQEAGALIGALVGGVIGNKVGGRKATLETVVGAGVGAAAGSAVGCKLQHNKQAQAYNSYDRPATYSRNGYRLSSDIAPANYNRIGDTFVARSTVNLRAAPTTGSARVGALRAGERFQALANVRGTDWILVGQGGTGVGYVRGDFVQREGQRYAARY